MERTFDLDLDKVVGILQALLDLAAVEACVVVQQVVEFQGEVSRGRVIVR